MREMELKAYSLIEARVLKYFKCTKCRNEKCEIIFLNMNNTHEWFCPSCLIKELNKSKSN